MQNILNEVAYPREIEVSDSVHSRSSLAKVCKVSLCIMISLPNYNSNPQGLLENPNAYLHRFLFII